MTEAILEFLLLFGIIAMNLFSFMYKQKQLFSFEINIFITNVKVLIKNVSLFTEISRLFLKHLPRNKKLKKNIKYKINL